MDRNGDTLQDTQCGGFALALAVFALVVVGALATGGLYLARQATLTGMAHQRNSRALYVAERAVAEVVEGWDANAMGALPVMGEATLSGVTGDGVWSVEVRRDSHWIYYLEAQGTVAEAGPLRNSASRRLGLVVKMRPPDLTLRAALTTGGSTRTGGNSVVSGEDTPPHGSEGGRADWSRVCPIEGPTVHPGILAGEVEDRDGVGGRGQGRWFEAPEQAGESRAAEASAPWAGGVGWDDLTELATIKTPSARPSPTPVLGTGGRCDTSVPTNWGNPFDLDHPCSDYFPVIHRQGDMELAGGFGQGILLVDGDLKVVGGTEFYGLVIVQGGIQVVGSGGRLWGGVVTTNRGGSGNTLVGNAVIQYSSCAIQRALSNSALTRVETLGERAWADLSTDRTP